MTVRGTLGLLGLFAALALYLLVVAPPPERPPPLEDPLLSVPAEQVTRLEVRWPDGHLEARRVDGVWRVDGEGGVASEAIDDLLAVLATLRPTTILARDVAAGDYGLGPAATSLTLSANGATVLHLLVGNRNPALTGVYVQRTGSDELWLVGALLHWELEKLHALVTR